MPLCTCGCLKELTRQQCYNHLHNGSSHSDQASAHAIWNKEELQTGLERAEALLLEPLPARLMSHFSDARAPSPDPTSLPATPRYLSPAPQFEPEPIENDAEPVSSHLCWDWIEYDLMSEGGSETNCSEVGSVQWDDDEESSEHEDLVEYGIFAEQVIQAFEDERKAQREGEIFQSYKRTLDESDKDNINMFALRLETNISRSAANKFRHAFGDKLDLDTFYLMHRRIAGLSGIEPQLYDCCINSCCAFTGDLSELLNCPYCAEPRYAESKDCAEPRSAPKKPRARYEYLPLIPRLQGYFLNDRMTDLMSYRATRVSEPGKSSDIFDGTHYKGLCQSQITVDGVEYDAYLFAGTNDIALGLLSDGFQVFKRARNGSASAWPFILINYNLPPEIRTHLKYIIPLGIAPGPHSPKDHNSYLYPFACEMQRLAQGVSSWSAVTRAIFLLRAFLLTKIGDMQAIKANQYIKGPNAFSPCRTCRIQGCRDPDVRPLPYYYPLIAPEGAIRLDRKPGVDWDPEALPLRTDETYARSIQYIEEGRTDTERDRRAKTQGVNGESILVQLPGFSRSQSCPHEFMHLIFENIVPNLVNLWTGRFKGLDEGVETYEIQSNIWDRIGEETSAATSSIPAAFCRTLPNIAKERSLFTAEAWAFWFVYLAPYLLQGRLPEKFYDHTMLLVNIIKLCLQFVIMDEELEALEEMVISWVRQYEEYYYQYEKERLCVCTSTIHALLHVPLDIKRTGPVWINWSFVMERYCGCLLGAVKSRSKPYTALSRRQLHQSQISQVQLKYGLDLNFGDDVRDVSSKEVVYPEFPLSILRFPRVLMYEPAPALLRKIAVHLATELRKPFTFIMDALPRHMERWGKVRIGDGGDCIRTSSTPTNQTGRDTSYVRYDLNVDIHAEDRDVDSVFESRCFYGQLQMILVCTLPVHPLFGSKPIRRLLAVVHTCETHGFDATLGPVTYSKLRTSTEVIELTAISCVVGRVKVGTGRTWGIIDRSKGLVRPAFVDDPELVAEMEDM